MKGKPIRQAAAGSGEGVAKHVALACGMDSFLISGRRGNLQSTFQGAFFFSVRKWSQRSFYLSLVILTLQTVKAGLGCGRSSWRWSKLSNQWGLCLGVVFLLEAFGSLSWGVLCSEGRYLCKSKSLPLHHHLIPTTPSWGVFGLVRPRSLLCHQRWWCPWSFNGLAVYWVGNIYIVMRPKKY